MKVVIDIPEEIYRKIKKTSTVISGRKNGERIDYILFNAVNVGTPLPKGHGRLIDADELKKEYPHDEDWEYPVSTNCYVVESIDNSPTIIEAESEDKECTKVQ